MSELFSVKEKHVFFVVSTYGEWDSYEERINGIWEKEEDAIHHKNKILLWIADCKSRREPFVGIPDSCLSKDQLKMIAEYKIEQRDAKNFNEVDIRKYALNAFL